jgi:hypothetical protein
MSITTVYVRDAARVTSHQIQTGDTTTDINDWLTALYPDGNPGPDSWAIDDGVGGFSFWNGELQTYSIPASVGDYIIENGNIFSPTAYTKQYFPDPT